MISKDGKLYSHYSSWVPIGFHDEIGCGIVADEFDGQWKDFETKELW